MDGTGFWVELFLNSQSVREARVLSSPLWSSGCLTQRREELLLKNFFGIDDPTFGGFFTYKVVIIDLKIRYLTRDFDPYFTAWRQCFSRDLVHIWGLFIEEWGLSLPSSSRTPQNTKIKSKKLARAVKWTTVENQYSAEHCHEVIFTRALCPNNNQKHENVTDRL